MSFFHFKVHVTLLTKNPPVIGLHAKEIPESDLAFENLKL